MDHIKNQLDQLADLNDEQVIELQNSIVSEFETVESNDPTPQTVEAMTELADALDSVRGESKRREALAGELSARASELSSRVHGGDDDAVEDAEEVIEEKDDDEAAEEAAVEVPAEDSPAPVQASAEPATETELSTDEVVDAPSEEAEAPAAEFSEDTEVETPASTDAELSTEEKDEDDEDEKKELPFSAEDAETDTPEPAAETEFSADEATEEAAEPTTETELSTEAPAEAEAEVPVEAEASNSEESTDEPQAQEEAPVTAPANDAEFSAPADRQPVTKAIEAPTAITAGADLPGITAGSPLSDMKEVAKAMTDRLHTMRNARGGNGEQYIVASVATEYPESRRLTNDALENSAKIDAVTGPEALVASGGFGTPVETRYDIFGFGTDARPVRDSLPRFQANRGGIRFVKPPVLPDYAGATGIWTEADDIAAASNTGVDDTVKNSLTVTGAVEQVAMTDAVTLQLQIGNLLSRAYPELVARHNELAFIQHAREAEINLLNKIETASTAVTSSSVIGFARDFLVQVKRAATAYRSRHRIDPGTQLRAIIPMWVYDAMAADLTLQMPGDDALGTSRGDINSYLASSNVTLVASYDLNVFGAQTPGALLEFPDTFKWFLFSEGSFLFLDGGTLDLGIVRDSGLVGTNDYKMFVETFEGLAFVGIESLAVTSTINVNGTAAALTAPVDY